MPAAIPEHREDLSLRHKLLVNAALKFRRRAIPPQTTIPPGVKPVKIVCVSDTHMTQPAVPDGDLFIHAGDLSKYGTQAEVQAQLDWINTLSHRFKVVISGNHDFVLDSAYTSAQPKPMRWGDRGALDWGTITYLEKTSATLFFPDQDRTLVVYGSPQTPSLRPWAFQYHPTTDVWNGAIPDMADIVVVHGPPRSYLDDKKGCPHLLRELWRVKPRLVVFGHIHEGRGRDRLVFDAAANARDMVIAGFVPGLRDVVRGYLSKPLRRASVRSSAMLVNASSVGQFGNPIPPGDRYTVVYL